MTKKQYDFINQGLEKYYNQLANMSLEERKYFLKNSLFNQPIDFEKEIDGTVYSVKTIFNPDAKESIQEKMIRILGLKEQDVEKLSESD